MGIVKLSLVTQEIRKLPLRFRPHCQGDGATEDATVVSRVDGCYRGAVTARPQHAERSA
jgi:hypothetical protein